MRTSLVALFCLFSTITIVLAAPPAPILPEQLTWVSPPALPALRSAWLIGNESQPALYLLRVKLAAGGRIPPHTHPDDRVTTVLSGTLWAGFGATFEESRAVAIPAGAAYRAPAGAAHFVWAKGGDVEYQEMGKGPTGTVFLPAEPARE
ncbi:MAG TPA: cupin domain-containing protein [Candidatus Competibacter sp.]|nr:cupin domain-containing protein [Candidatus Competibacter sp.]